MAGGKDPDNTAFSSASSPGRGYHDIGGLPAGEVETSVSEPRPWEKLSVVLSNVLGLSGKKLITVDETRRTREEMGVELYNELGYFERNTQALYAVLTEKGIVDKDRLEARMAEIAKRIAQEGR